MKYRTIAAALVAVCAAGYGGAAAAQWPERPITLIVPFPAGGGTDTFARPLAQQLTTQLGQTVVIDNKGGAGGTVGAGVAAKARPDGYTFFMGGAHHALAPSLYKNLSYDIQKDFVPVALVAQPPQVIVINPGKLPVKTVQELIAYVKKRPGEINFGTAGKGSTHHLAGELFKKRAGIDILHVPFKGATQALPALISGEVDLFFDMVATGMPQADAGKVKVFAITSPTRLPTQPKLATMAEQGYPDFDLTAWFSFVAPKGTPAPAMDKLRQALADATGRAGQHQRATAVIERIHFTPPSERRRPRRRRNPRPCRGLRRPHRSHR